MFRGIISSSKSVSAVGNAVNIRETFEVSVFSLTAR
jgi:hypothetical protein